MRTKTRFFPHLFLSLFALLPVACEGESTEEEEEQPTEWSDPDGQPVTWEPARPDGLTWELLDTTTYIKAPDSDLVTVEETSLRMPASDFADLLDLQAGDAIIGNPHASFAATNPQGFIRKVVSVSQEGDEIVVETEGATLADAFESCDMVATVELADFEDLDFVAQDGTKISPKSLGGEDGGEPGANPNISFNAAGTVLYEGNGLKASISKGNFQFAPSFNFDLDASLTKGLKRLSGVATGTQSAELEVKLETTTGVDEDFEKEYSAPPIPITLGPIVVLVTPKLFMGCSVDIPSGINLTAGMKQTASVAVGAEYIKGEGVHGIAQTSFTLTRLGPTFNTGAPLEARCYIRPELHAGLNIIVANAGVKIAMEGHAEASANVTNNVCKVDMELGVEGTVGIEATAFGFDALDENLTIFTKTVPILDNQSCLPKKGVAL